VDDTGTHADSAIRPRLTREQTEILIAACYSTMRQLTDDMGAPDIAERLFGAKVAP
jgi:hypothetical protein